MKNLVVLSIAIFLLSACDVFSAPARVVNKTAETNNIITSYEWFYDVNAQFESRVIEIRSTKDIIKQESDPKQKTLLLTELRAQQQSCRDMVTRYNANSKKTNKMIFKSNGLPDTLYISFCE